MAFEKCITIIGGGFSGTLAAVQLLRQSPFPVSVRVINCGYPVAKGVAYSSQDPLHLLNVRSGRMSAFPHLPHHFTTWLSTQPDSAQFCQPGQNLADAFMPRQLFGRYLEHVLQHAVDNLPAGSKFGIIEDEALAVEPLANKHFKITLKNSPAVETEKIILALGNFAPEKLPGISPEVEVSGAYFNNPWQPEAAQDLGSDQPILLIGTGLTMIDVVLSLLENDFRGKIYAVSTKGFLPMVHQPSKPYLGLREALMPPFELDSLYPTIKKHIRQAVAQGSTCETLIDSMRPQTQEIWQGLSLPDKQKFLRHLSSLWGVFRHRISPQIGATIQAALNSGQLQIRAGRLWNTGFENGNIKAEIKLKGKPEPEKLNVQRLVNCTGPQVNYGRIASPLVQNLITQQLIAPDDLRLGLKASPNGKLVLPGGKPSNAVFTIGPALRGVLWESTAVPEISEQAAHLAQTVLHTFYDSPETKTENNPAPAEK